MLIKTSSLSECLAKGFTLNAQIEAEAKELADEYIWQARIELDVAKEQAKTPEIRAMLRDPKTLEKATQLAKDRAWKETAEKYRTGEASNGVHTSR
jgi:hypothetical protein